MDLRYTEQEEAFRGEVRAWLEEVLPSVPPEPDRNDWAARRVYDMGWQRMLHDAGYAGINWPKEYGGRGATPTEHLIFLEETERARAPYVGMNFVGQLHAGPTLIVEATPEQKAFHLPGILKGEHVWCQGFSEPNAGSDLASLRCKAERDGDDYVINGQKIWTSYGHVAEYCEMLVRTDFDVPKHKGITWLIVPMDREGIDIRPLLTMEGSSEFCEVFFDDVRVPVVNRVGDENDGWRVANVTLSFERGTAFVSDVLQTQVLVRDLAELAGRSRAAAPPSGKTPASDATSARSRPSSTRCGRSPSATSRRRNAAVSSVPAAARSSSRSPSCATGSAISPCTCSTARRSASTTSAISGSTSRCAAASGRCR